MAFADTGGNDVMGAVWHIKGVNSACLGENVFRDSVKVKILYERAQSELDRVDEEIKRLHKKRCPVQKSLQVSYCEGCASSAPGHDEQAYCDLDKLQRRAELLSVQVIRLRDVLRKSK